MEQLSVGIIARSRKESERRLAIHPRHLERIEPELRGRVLLETGYGEPFGMPGRAAAPTGRRPPPSRAPVRRRRRHPAAQTRAPGPGRDARGAGAVGLAALRAGRRDHPAGDRPATDGDRLRGDEPLDRGRGVQPSRAAQEQRARRVRLGPPRAVPRRVDRRLRPEADRGRHRVRGDRAGRRDGPGGDGGHRRRRPDAPGRGGRRVADPLRPARAVRARRERPEPQRGRYRDRSRTPGRLPRRSRHHRQLRPAGPEPAR